MTRPDRAAVEELVYRSCLLLDEQDFKGFMALCHPGFRYRLSAWSPEIRREMTWLDRDRAEMESFFGMLPKHNTDHAALTRHATVYTLGFDAAGEEAHVVSALEVYRTALDGGATRLFAVGKYHDTVRLADGAPTLLSRCVRLVTRDLGWGHHIPL
jgi:methanesulfonate monooxygenase small subunit